MLNGVITVIVLAVIVEAGMVMVTAVVEVVMTVVLVVFEELVPAVGMCWCEVSSRGSKR